MHDGNIEEKNVMDILIDYGGWEMDRFATNFKSLSVEYPRETLKYRKL